MKKFFVVALSLAVLMSCFAPISAFAMLKYPVEIKSGTKVDLDGDKKEETILWSEESTVDSDILSVKVGDNSFKLVYEGDYFAKLCYMDVDTSDKYKELLLFSCSWANEYISIFRYDGKKLIRARLESLYSDYYDEDKNFYFYRDYITTTGKGSIYKIDSWPDNAWCVDGARVEYKLDKNDFIFKEKKSPVYKTNLKEEAIQDIVYRVSNAPDAKKATLKKGTKLILVATDAREWVKFVTLNGKLGYIRLKKGNISILADSGKAVVDVLKESWWG